ncbi:phenylacetate-CoA ligase [Malonomonas rubra DSM 5091]|uniref:Phenylacetate-CoA ligase n=1 Tax=Malonomonas rubra DSM 5091 TaxID=1122189 RepID=A0A1M6FKQ5_MALRU|nr:AMP-binding protein [Malonomonas rubra]SHI98254.1 phenylacetate-CoA ligase [Malonomonas rubra DSM 5091]
MSQFYDALETRSAQEREEQQFAQLAETINQAIEQSPYYKELLADFADLKQIDAETLAKLPLTRKSELQKLQQEHPPFGGLANLSPPKLKRLFASSGPIYEPQTSGEDGWRFARALYAAGLRSGELLYNCFSYHFTPAGAMAESGAFALDCAVFPAGIGQTELQARTIADLRPQAYVGTPSFLKIILDKGDELGLDLSSLSKGLVSGEYFPPALRKEYADRGIEVMQCYATADLGVIAYETVADQGLIVDEGVIVEIVRPGTGDLVADGEVGEVVVTCLNSDYPLIRFATGDLSAFITEPSPCGRTNRRLKGWMGRADQSAKLRALFVYPSQIAQVLARHSEASKGRLVITRNDKGLDEACFQVETSKPSQEGLGQGLIDSFQKITRLRVDVSLCEPGSLANDGIVIDDQRSIDD